MGENTITRARLTTAQYDALVKSLGVVSFVSAGTTELQAGQMIGVELVLRKLREGFVIEAE